ncbi:MAG: hypothetical protein J7L98_00040 [Candidatus Verstraetearchaeota archaeon]|nr:hypothetical protein [Candidatus Verstraetearchaeota archaeon]
MPLVDGRSLEGEAVLEVAKLMCIAARTAPKSGGIDDILTAVVTGEERDRLAEEMEKIYEETGQKGFLRDAKNVRDSEVVVLIGVRGAKHLEPEMNCGACGFAGCSAFEQVEKKRRARDFIGPNCMFKLLDLGIAIGSAVKTASIHNVDNRVMYRIGAAAVRLNYLPEASVVMGIPLSAKGKSIYFDRKM